MSRKKSRINSMNIIYQVEIGTLNPKDVLLHLKNNHNKDIFLFSLVENSINYREFIIEYITPILKNWEYNRLGFLEKSIFLLSFSEMFFLKNIPIIVSINEWVSITKKYCGEDAKKFVNGVLNEVKNKLIKEKIRDIK